MEEDSFLFLMSLENPASSDQCSSSDPRQPAGSARAGAWARTGAWARAECPAEPTEYALIPATAYSKNLAMRVLRWGWMGIAGTSFPS